MDCSEALRAYERTLVEAREFRILGSTEVAVEVMRALARVVGSCHKQPINMEGLVRSAISARPTSQAVRNLLMLFFEKLLEKASTPSEIAAEVGEVVREVENYVARARDTVSELASRRIEDGDTVMTHSYSTTVLKVLTKALERGLNISAYVTESRPGGEGKLTASHLGRMGVKTFLVVDSAARYVMKGVDKVIVSAEAIAANGAVVNKVGTSALALAAKEARVRVYVVSGLYKFGTETLFGELVTIEEIEKPDFIIPSERIGELAPFIGRNLHVRTPLYDVTPPEYIDAIVTERGLIAPQAAIYLARELVGWPKARRSLDVVLAEVASLWR
ncbi:MAG: hypothetical protein QW780_01125 [Sulfolobales archaeon]